MKLTKYLLLIFLLLLPLFSEVTQNMVVKSEYGQKIFRKKLRKICKFTAARFAQAHTRKEWGKLKNSNQFFAEIQNLCPKSAHILKEQWMEPLFALAVIYAKDTEEYPE